MSPKRLRGGGASASGLSGAVFVVTRPPYRDRSRIDFADADRAALVAKHPELHRCRSRNSLRVARVECSAASLINPFSAAVNRGVGDAHARHGVTHRVDAVRSDACPGERHAVISGAGRSVAEGRSRSVRRPGSAPAGAASPPPPQPRLSVRCATLRCRSCPVSRSRTTYARQRPNRVSSRKDRRRAASTCQTS